MGPVQIALYDLKGTLRVLTQSGSVSGKEVTIPISDFLENGTYVYQIMTKAGRASGKVVVQH